jgi:hypothetical protein
VEKDPKPVNFRIDVAEDLEGGVYANFLSVWHTAHEFTLDFAATLPAQEEDDQMVVPCRVTTRVKIPPTLLFDLLRALNGNMTRYEETFGEIRKPGEDEEEAPA